MGLYYPCSETKAVISFAVTAKLICVFVFEYAKNMFSHDAAQIMFGSHNDPLTLSKHYHRN